MHSSNLPIIKSPWPVRRITRRAGRNQKEVSRVFCRREEGMVALLETSKEERSWRISFGGVAAVWVAGSEKGGAGQGSLE